MIQESLLLMGGTFDPIHTGHMIIAERIRCTLGIEKVLFLPAGNPPHKAQKTVSSAHHRYIMTNLAISTREYFSISDLEIQRPGLTYTIDTLQTLKKARPERKLYFVIGEDSLQSLASWKGYERLFDYATFVVAARGDREIDTSLEVFERYPQSIAIVETPLLEISSTDIRQRIKTGKSIAYLVDERVEHYIRREQLYKN